MDQTTGFSGFLASRMGGESDPIRVLREQIYRLGQSLQRPIWVAEHSVPNELRGLSELDVQRTCVEQARLATDFICILDGSYGTPWNETEFCVLELELIAATLANTRFHLFKLFPYDRDPRTDYLVRAVLSARPEVPNREPQSPAEILSDLQTILGSVPRPTARRLSLNDLDLDVRFLAGQFTPISDTPPAEESIRELLQRSITASDEPTRLIHSWMAVRHLCAAPYADKRFSRYLPLWDLALSEWAAAAAWYGLHGTHKLGRLAAVNTMIAIRQRMAESSTGIRRDQSIQGSYGALASEYYSIAKTLRSRKERKELLSRALKAVDLALDGGQPDLSGLLAIRGSVLQALGRRRAALEDYKQMLTIRIRAGDNKGRLGEAKAELGMGYLRLGRVWLAGRLLSDGVADLEAANRQQFLVRALRKLGVFYLVTLRPRRAFAVLQRAHAMAGARRINDQLRQLEPTLHTLSKVLRFRANRVRSQGKNVSGADDPSIH